MLRQPIDSGWLMAVLLLCTMMRAATAADYQIEIVAQDLDHPWALAFLPDGRVLVTERPGRLRVIEHGVLADAPVGGVPEVFAESQGGLLDVAVDPDFVRNRFVYLSLAQGDAEANTTRVFRARLVEEALVDVTPIFTARPARNTPVHYGGRLLFLPDGTLLVGLGDGFDFRERAQSLADHFGTVVRIHTDGTVPVDNPYVGRDDALPEIYSHGHRNVQGLAWDVAREAIWQHEHGPRGGDELQRLVPGSNYGWPAATHGIDYSGALISPYESLPGRVDPLWTWTPSIAPAGLAVVEGPAFPAWQGDLLVTGLASRDLRRLEISGERVVAEHVLLAELDERLREVRIAPDGTPWITTDSDRGRVLRLVPAGFESQRATEPTT